MKPASFLAAGDPVLLEGENGMDLVEALASRLWDRVSPGPPRSIPIRIRVRIEDGRPAGDPDRDGAWRLDDAEVRFEAAGISLHVFPVRGEAEATVARRLVEESPALAARLVLETPVTLAKMTRRQLLHAGALVGSRGAVVLRGAAGAGKSTLVAAGWKAGLGVLGDESVLVRRDDPDALEATLRDLALPPDSARLLGLTERTEAAFSGGEEKRRVPLFDAARPADRTARRLATILLGPREPGPARLVPLAPADFRNLFPAGEIPQERSFGADPSRVVEAWSLSGAFLLDGASDLAKAVSLVTEITGPP